MVGRILAGFGGWGALACFGALAFGAGLDLAAV
jgi:hypothetical protein